MICIICKEEFYRQTEYEPAEPCLCGEMAFGSLWDWDGIRAYRKWLRFHIAGLCYKLGNYLVNWRKNGKPR